MLGKLFKYDMRAGAKLMVPASLFVIATTLFGTLALRFSCQGVNAFPKGSVAADLFNAATAMVFGMSVVALIFYAVASFIMVLVHYYRNLFTDEGYLTFTLPVSTSSLITSKMLASVLWIAVAAVITMGCVLVYVTFGPVPKGQLIYEDFYREVGELMRIIGKEITVDIVFFLIETVVLVIVSVFGAVLQAYLAITIGAIVAKKHKILASVGFYYIINMAISIVINIFTSVFLFGSSEFLETGTLDIMTGTASFIGVLHLYMIINIVFSLIISITEFLVNRYLLKNKLNIQ